MTEPDRTIIGGSKTCGDWRVFCGNLVPGGDRALWEAAFVDYFHPRIQLRYFDPIEILQQLGPNQGEGFSIAAIHCTLIEFLESTIQGINYRCVQRDADLGPHEYRKSGPVFVAFLTEREPFRKCFTSSDLGWEFYKNVRCGLLHEARTKGGWTILANGHLRRSLIRIAAFFTATISIRRSYSSLNGIVRRSSQTYLFRRPFYASSMISASSETPYNRGLNQTAQRRCSRFS